jgi:hypothetical protein
MSEDIQNLLNDLLMNYSSIYNMNKPGDSIVIISPSGDYAYEELTEQGRQVQAQLLDEYRRFYEVINVLLRNQPKDTLAELFKANKILLNTIEQNNTTWCKNTTEALDKAVQALKMQCKLLNRLYDPFEGEVIFVPDTNALIYNPNLESWTFMECPQFSLFLLPTVLSELDLLKINHRNVEVRNKSESLIRRIKEYRRRGKLTTGVTVVKGRIKIQSIAIEPDMNTSLPWLDPDNKDDRILAGVIEVMRARPRSIVKAVSRDINFQNKAEFANIPFEEPPAID